MDTWPQLYSRIIFCSPIRSVSVEFGRVPLCASGAGGLAPVHSRCYHQAPLPEWDAFSKTGEVLRKTPAVSQRLKAFVCLWATASTSDILIRVLVKDYGGRLIKKCVIGDLIIWSAQILMIMSFIIMWNENENRTCLGIPDPAYWL